MIFNLFGNSPIGRGALVTADQLEIRLEKWLPLLETNARAIESVALTRVL